MKKGDIIKGKEIKEFMKDDAPLDYKDFFPLSDLINNVINQWKKEFDSNSVKTESIMDLEKLVKLNILLKEENNRTKQITNEIVDKVIAAIKEVIEDPELLILIFEKLRGLKYL